MKPSPKIININPVLTDKLLKIRVTNLEDLIQIGSEDALIKLSTLENSGVCINMLYALEGAIQGVRWHQLSKDRKQQLLDFYTSMHFDDKR